MEFSERQQYYIFFNAPEKLRENFSHRAPKRCYSNANTNNVNYTITNDSLIEIDLSTSFRDWFIEQRNKLILQKQYKFKHRFAVSLFWISKMIFFVLGILLFFIYPLKVILFTFLAYFLVLYIVIGLSAKKLKEPHLIFFLPFLEIGLLLIQFTIFIANLFAKPKI